MSGPRSLRSLLETWQPVDAAGGAPDPSAAVALAWRDAVGGDVARRTRPGRLRDGVLTVFTAGSAWSHQLTFLAPHIVAALNERCPSSPVTRLRFTVASGKTRAMIEEAARRSSAHRAAPAMQTTAAAADPDGDRERAEDIVARLRRRQRALDRRRAQAGWTRCPTCGSWRDPSVTGAGAICAVCADAEQRAADAAVERVLVDAPWLGFDELASHVPGATAVSFARVRGRLAGRWQEQMFNARRRVGRGTLQPADRVAAWSSLMLRAGTPQHRIGRAVVLDALGREWADALAPAREATASAAKKQRTTTARVLPRRDPS